MSDAKHQADLQMATIRGFVDALEVDYDRINELQEEIEDLKDHIRDLVGEGLEELVGEGLVGLQVELEELQAELDDLLEKADECESYDDAVERIHEDALSVEVKSGWTPTGAEMEAQEYRIVICTGGPHVQIRGELDRFDEPKSAWLEYCGWFEPMTERLNEDGDEEALLTYARAFYFSS